MKCVAKRDACSRSSVGLQLGTCRLKGRRYRVSSGEARAGLLGSLVLVSLVPVVQPRGQDPSQELFQEAQAAKARGDLPEAERKYLELIRRSPEILDCASPMIHTPSVPGS